MRPNLRSGFERGAGSRPLSFLARGVWRDQPRVLAYHRVSSSQDIRRHLKVIQSGYRVISGAEFSRAVLGKGRLPGRSVWITFDDGDPSVVRHALPVLRETGVPATMFVCPGLVETGEPFWWSTVEEAVRRGIWPVGGSQSRAMPGAVTSLKHVPDAERRRVVAQFAQRLVESGVDTWGPGQLSLDDLRRWCDAGLEIGNHTWDHPCLDQTERSEQRWQIEHAQQWLEDHGLVADRTFAYPNGDWTPEAEQVLTELGFQVALLFDHRLASVDHPPLRVSRLKIDASASDERLRSILSGVHSAAFSLARRLRHRPDDSTGRSDEEPTSAPRP